MHCLRPKLVKNSITGRFIPVPCRTCVACLHNRQKDWAFRLMMENKYSAHPSYFVTLTFDDALILDKPSLSQELDKDFLALFIKRLHRRFEYHNISKCRYFGCGEYGDLGRAHYHLILFDVPLNRVELSVLIEDVWRLGFCTVEPITDGRCMYVAKYTCKELFNDKFYSDKKQKPFASMTRVPALGSKMLKDKDITKRLKDEQLFHVFSENGSVFNLPRYYKNKIFSSYERELHAELVESSDVLISAIGTPEYVKLAYQKQLIDSCYERNFFKRLQESREIQFGPSAGSFPQTDD